MYLVSCEQVPQTAFAEQTMPAPEPHLYVSICQHMSEYGSIRQHTSAYGSIRQLTSAYVSIRQHTSAFAERTNAPEPHLYIKLYNRALIEP